MPKEAVVTGDGLIFFDKLVDTLNGSSSEEKNVDKEFRKLWTPTSSHEAFLRTAKAEIHKMRYVDEESKKPISVPCLKNLEDTIEGFLSLWKKLQQMGFTEFNPRHVNQDPLENFFGSVRAIACKNDIPTCKQYKGSFKSLLIQNISSPHSMGANCIDDGGHAVKAWSNFKNCQENEVKDVDLSIKRTGISKPIEEKGKAFCSIHSVMKEIYLKMKGNFECCSDCMEFFKNKESQSGISILNGLMGNTKEVLQIIVSKAYRSTNVKARCLNVLKKEIDFACYTCKIHRAEFVDHFLNAAIQQYISSVTTYLNQVLNGKLVVSTKEKNELVAAASEKHSKTLKKKFRDVI